MRMMMRNMAFLCVAVAIVGAASCASSGGKLQPAPPPAVAGPAAVTPPAEVKKRMTRIVVKTSESGACTATIDDYKITGKIGKRIAWMVENNSNSCPDGENWHIELDFATGWNNGNNRIVKIHPDELTSVKIHQNTRPTAGTPLEYKVYMVYPRFLAPALRIPVIDPELDIEM